MSHLVFLDTETSGLDPDRHHVWEIGAIVRGHPRGYDGEWLWQLRPNLAEAEPAGLRVGRYYEREQLWRVAPASAVTLASPWWDDKKREAGHAPTGNGLVANDLARMLDGGHLVGAVPDFDARFLTRFLRKHGQAPTWHYHLIDIEALMVGYLHGRSDVQLAVELPWKSDDLSKAAGVEPPSAAERHTALGDARWAMRVYDAVTGGASVPGSDG